MHRFFGSFLADPLPEQASTSSISPRDMAPGKEISPPRKPCATAYDGLGTSMKAKAGRAHSISATNEFPYLKNLWSKDVMIRASELLVKICCHLWKDCDTQPVLKNQISIFAANRISSAIDTLIVQARKQFHHRNNSPRALCQPCKAWPPLATEDTSLAYWLQCRRQGLERAMPNATRTDW